MGEKGIFPANYVQVLSELVPAAPRANANSSSFSAASFGSSFGATNESNARISTPSKVHGDYRGEGSMKLQVNGVQYDKTNNWDPKIDEV